MLQPPPSPQTLRDRLSDAAITVLRNTTSLLVAQLSTTAVTVVLFALVARYLGAEQLGIYALAMTATELTAVFLDFGLNYLTTREMARQSPQIGTYLVGASILKGFLACIALFGLAKALPWFYQSPEIRHAVYLGVFLAIPRGFRDLFTAFFNGLERMPITALLLSSQAAVWLVVGVYVLRTDHGVLPLLLVRLFVDVAFAVIGLRILLRIRQFSLYRPKINFLYQLARLSLPFGLFVTGAAVYSRVDTIILSVIQDEMAVGIYEAGKRLMIVVEMVPALFSLALYPTLSRILTKRPLDAQRLIAQSIRYMLILGLPIATGIVLTALKLVTLAYGAGYDATVTVLQILGLVIPIRYCAHILGIVLLASDNSWARARGTWLAAATNIALNVLLIPRLGFVGASIVSVMTSIVLIAYYYRQVNVVQQIDTRNSLGPVTAASILMGIMILLLGNIALFPLIGLAVLCYVVFLIGFQGVTYSDYLFLKGLFHRQLSRAERPDAGKS